MYAVVTLKNSVVNIVIPANWIDGITIEKFANEGCTNSLPFKIFYSTDERKEANFTLVIKNYFEKLDSDSCFIAYFRKFFGKCFNRTFIKNRQIYFQIELIANES